MLKKRDPLSDNPTTDNNDYDTNNNEFSENPPKSKHHKRKFHLNKKGRILLVAALCILAAACFGIVRIIFSSDYMRPSKNICSIFNDRETDIVSIYDNMYAGKEQTAYSKAVRILEDSDYYKDYYTTLSTDLESNYRDIVSRYGTKMIFDITGEKKKMSESDLAITHKNLEADSVEYQTMLDTLNSMEKDDYSAMAELLGISTTKAKTLCGYIKDMASNRADFKISSGYFITGRFVIVDEEQNTIAKTEKITLCVIKINGHWTIIDGMQDGVFLATNCCDLTDTDLLKNIYYEFIK